MVEKTADHSATELSNELPLVLPTRVIAYAWGDKYVSELLSLTLPALLAPGNLPYVAGAVPCEVVILTQQRFFARFLSDATVVRMQEFCPVRLFALDDLVSAPDKYGIALTHVLHRGFADLGPAVTDSWLMFLNADFILADGSLRNLLKWLATGERLVASPSYCVHSQAVVPELLRRLDPHTRSLTLGPREMASLVLRHRHNTIRGKTVNQSLFSIRYMDQFYWEVDSDTLLGHQMPVAIAGMRPERYLAEPNSYWDHGLMREFVPQASHCVIGDSDEFLMLELRGEDVAQDQLRLGLPEPAEIARNTTSFMTAYQRDMAQYPLTLHARDLPAGADSARQQLRAFVDSVLVHLPAVLPSYLDHPQWNYHRPGFIQTRHDYLSKQLGRATETGEPPLGLSELDRVWWMLDGLNKSHERRRAQLVELRDHQRQLLDVLQKRLEVWIEGEREALREKLTNDVASIPIHRGVQGGGIELYHMLNACAESAPSDISPGAERPWVAPLDKAADSWIAFDNEAEARREALANALIWTESHYGNRLAMLDLEFQSASGPLQTEYDRLAKARLASAVVPHVSMRHGPHSTDAIPSGRSLDALAKRIYRRLFGAVPRVTQLHPYWAPLRHLVRLVDEAAGLETAKVLVVIGKGGIADRIADPLPGAHGLVSRAEVVQGNLAAAFNQTREIDLCVCPLETSELSEFTEIVRAVRPCMREGGKILGLYPNFDLAPLPMHDGQFLRDLSDLPGTTRVYYAGSAQSARVLRRYRKALAAPNKGRLGSAARIALALLTLSSNALAANRLEDLVPEDQLSRPPEPCSSLTIEVILPH